MGKRGPQSESAEKLRAKGSWRADKVTAKSGDVGAKTVALVKIRPPTWMSKAVKKKFRQTIKVMEDGGRRFTAADIDVLAAYAQTFVSWRLAEMQLAILLENDETALWYETEKGSKDIHPMVKVAEKARNAMLRAAKEIGLTPLPETRFAVQQDEISPTAARFKKLRGAG